MSYQMSAFRVWGQRYYTTTLPPETDSRMTKLQVNRKSSGSGGELPLSRSETSLCTNDVYTIIIRKTKIARKKFRGEGTTSVETKLDTDERPIFSH